MTSPEFLDELETFVEMISPAWAAAIVAAWAELSRPLTPEEVEELLHKVLHEKAGDIFREIHGANVMAASRWEKTAMSKRRKVPPDDVSAQFEELVAQLATLQAISNDDFPTDEEMDRFFGLILPVQQAAFELEQSKANAEGRSLTEADFRAVSIKVFVDAAGNAAREVWGATIGELIDGRKPQ